MNNLLVGIPRLCECFSCFKGTSYPHPVFSNPVIFVLKKENHLSDRPSVRRHLCSQPLIDSLFQTATAKLDFKYHPQSDNSHPCMIVDECGCFTPNYMIVLAFYVHTHTHTRTPTPNLLVSPPEAHILGTIQRLWGFLGVAKNRRFEQPKCGVKL